MLTLHVNLNSVDSVMYRALFYCTAVVSGPGCTTIKWTLTWQCTGRYLTVQRWCQDPLTPQWMDSYLTVYRALFYCTAVVSGPCDTTMKWTLTWQCTRLCFTVQRWCQDPVTPQWSRHLLDSVQGLVLLYSGGVRTLWHHNEVDTYLTVYRALFYCTAVVSGPCDTTMKWTLTLQCTGRCFTVQCWCQDPVTSQWSEHLLYSVQGIVLLYSGGVRTLWHHNEANTYLTVYRALFCCTVWAGRSRRVASSMSGPRETAVKWIGFCFSCCCLLIPETQCVWGLRSEVIAIQEWSPLGSCLLCTCLYHDVQNEISQIMAL